MPNKRMSNPSKITLLLILTIVLSACGASSQPTDAPSIPSASPLATEISSTPTPEIAPSVALVNGEALSAESYELSLSLYMMAVIENGTFLATEGIEQIVIDDLIARTLLAQGAREAGFAATDQIVNQRLQAAIEKAGC